MPRILGVDIPGRKRIEYSLRYIYGIGATLSAKVLEEAKIDPATKADDLVDAQITTIANILQTNHMIEGDLRRDTQQNIRRLISINSYRGRRHRFGLPCRGQRTSTNARTRKGPKKTVGAVRGKDARAAAKAK